MSKEYKIIEMLGEMAVQGTQQVLDSEARLMDKISEVRSEMQEIRTELKDEMREVRNENATFHDEMIGHFKKSSLQWEVLTFRG